MITAGFCGCSLGVLGVILLTRGWSCERVHFFIIWVVLLPNPLRTDLLKTKQSPIIFFTVPGFCYVTEPDRQRNTSMKKFNIFLKSLQPPVVGRFISRAHHWYETRTFAVSTREKSISERAFTLHINPGWYGPHFVSFLTWLMFYFMLRFCFFYCLTRVSPSFFRILSIKAVLY